MASSKQQILSIYGAFYLPLALLTGLTLSFILPAALSLLIPAVDFALFTSLPHLWNAFLSWVTPPCLFVLLNGIIVVLTASSGILSSSELGSGSDFYANLLGKMENSQIASSGALMVDLSASDSNPPPKMEDVQKQSSAAVVVDTHLPASYQALLCARSAAVRGETHLPASSQSMLCTRTPGDLKEEQSKIFEKEEDDGVDENPSNLSRRSMESRSFSHARSKSRIWEEEDEEGDYNDEFSGLPKLAVVNKSFSFGCRSEPSSPQFATPSKSNMIKRSLSVDSASFHDNKGSSGSPEDLSDEAFRKRIEDFIFKMNAQLRSEAK